MSRWQRFLGHLSFLHFKKESDRARENFDPNAWDWASHEQHAVLEAMEPRLLLSGTQLEFLPLTDQSSFNEQATAVDVDLPRDEPVQNTSPYNDVPDVDFDDRPNRIAGDNSDGTIFFRLPQPDRTRDNTELIRRSLFGTGEIQISAKIERMGGQERGLVFEIIDQQGSRTSLGGISFNGNEADTIDPIFAITWSDEVFKLYVDGELASTSTAHNSLFVDSRARRGTEVVPYANVNNLAPNNVSDITYYGSVLGDSGVRVVSETLNAQRGGQISSQTQSFSSGGKFGGGVQLLSGGGTEMLSGSTNLITEEEFTPDFSTAIDITFSNLVFDSSSTTGADVRDAFEIAILDPNTNESLIETIGPGSDSVFNIAEGMSTNEILMTDDVLFSGDTSSGTLRIDLSSVQNPPSTVKVVARLIDNDSDSANSVTVNLSASSNILWGINEDNGHLFGIWDISDPVSTFVDFGPIHVDISGLTPITSLIEALTVRNDGEAFLVVNDTVDGIAKPVLMHFDTADLTNTTTPVEATVVGRIPIDAGETYDGITGLDFDQSDNNRLYATMHFDGAGTADALYEITGFDPASPNLVATLVGMFEEHDSSAIILEAEDGTIESPMQTGTIDSAFEGEYVEVASGNNSTGSAPSTGKVTFTVNAPSTGNYHIFARVHAPDASSDSFWVSVNGGTEVKWNDIDQSAGWRWDQAHDSDNSDTPIVASLTSGNNTIDFYYREDGARLDQILVTSDLNYDPNSDATILTDVQDMSIAADGTLIVSDNGTGKLHEIDLGSAEILSEFDSESLADADAIAFDLNEETSTVLSRKTASGDAILRSVVDGGTNSDTFNLETFGLTDLEAMDMQTLSLPLPDRSTLFIADEDDGQVGVIWNTRYGDDSHGTLGIVHLNDGSNWVPMEGIEGIAIDQDGTVFVTHTGTISGTSISGDAKLLQFDATEWVMGAPIHATLVGSIMSNPGNVTFPTLAFDDEWTLFSVQAENDATNDTFVELDKTDGSIVSSTQFVDGASESIDWVQGIAFNSDASVLYVMDHDDKEIYTVNPSTATITGVYDDDVFNGLSNGGSARILAGDIDPLSSELNGVDAGDERVIEIDSGSGSNTVLFSTSPVGATEPEGMGFYPQVAITGGGDPPTSDDPNYWIESARSVINGVNTSELVNVTTSFDISYNYTGYSAATEILSTSLDITKNAQHAVREDLILAVSGLNKQDGAGGNTSAVPAGFDGVLATTVDGVPFGTPYLYISDLFETDSDGFYVHGSSIEDLLLQFLATEPTERFDFELTFLGNSNNAPSFTTLPSDEEFQGAAFASTRNGDEVHEVIEITSGETFTYTPLGEDPEGDDVTISLVDGPSGLSYTSGQISWTPTTAGSYQVRLRVTDEFGKFDAENDQFFTILVTSGGQNRAPIITTDPVTDATLGATYSYQVGAMDPDGDSITFEGRMIDVPNVSSQLAAHYAFDDIDGTDVADSSGNDRTATAVGSPDVDTDQGPAIRFDGTNDYLRVDDTDGAGAEDDWIHASFTDRTVSLWFKADGTSGTQTLYEQGGISNGLGIRINSGNLEARAANTDGTTETVDISTSFTDTTSWHHVAVIFDNGELRMFLDGTAITPVTASFSAVSTHSGGTGIGGTEVNGVWSGGSGNYFAGWISHVAIFEEALSAESVGLLIGPSVSSAGLVTWDPDTSLSGQTVNVWVRASDQQSPELVDTQEFSIGVDGPTGQYVLGDVDLVASNVDVSGIEIDGQTLTASGVVSVDVTNDSDGEMNMPFDVIFFEDLNLDEAYTASVDQLLGSTRVEHGFGASEMRTIAAVISGNTQFVGAPVWAFVDSSNEISETNEDNNLAGSHEECGIAIGAPGLSAPELERQITSFEDVVPMIDDNLLAGTPIIADLDGDQTPDFIVANYGIDLGNVLRAFSGVDGSPLWTISDDPDAYDFDYWAAVDNFAIGDVDRDGELEIVVDLLSGDIALFNSSGNIELSASGSLESGPISIANFDDTDPEPEIISGFAVFEHDLTPRSFSSWPTGLSTITPRSITADLDLDGVPEIISSNAAIKADGTAIWRRDSGQSTYPVISTGGFVAVTNFDTSDESPEVVVVADGKVYLLDEETGETIWSDDLPDNSFSLGAAPTVADFDGDGFPEIGVPAEDEFFIYDVDNEQFLGWTIATNDSSSFAMASAFDFDADGRHEIIYADHHYLRIIGVPTDPESSNLTEIHRIAISSGTGMFQYPTIADVDLDGNAEIIVTSNGVFDSYSGYQTGEVPPGPGLFVYGGEDDDWAGTRQIWNQYDYYSANINDDGKVPVLQEYDWNNNDTFRGNTVFTITPQPDIIPSYVRVDESGGQTTYTVRIGNAGSFFVHDDVEIAFYDGDPSGSGQLIDTAFTTMQLDPGEYEDVTLTVDGTPVSDLWVVADDDGTGQGSVTECNENNNVYNPQLGFVILPANNEPTIDEPIPTVAVANRPFSHTVEASDADTTNGQRLVFDLPSRPDGMIIDSVTGEITWTPTYDQIRTNSFVVRVRDGRGGEARENVRITVVPENEAPVITSSPHGPVEVGEDYTYQVTAEDPNGDQLLYELEGFVPSGMTIGLTTGELTWTDPQPDSMSDADQAVEVTIRVFDGRGGEDTQTVILSLDDTNEGPKITSKPDTTAVLLNSNPAWSYQVIASDATSLTYALDQNALDLGMTISSSGLVEWTPQFRGTYSATVTVTDADGATAKQVLTLPVKVKASSNVAPVFVDSLSGPAVLDGPWSTTIRVSDRNGDALTLSVLEKPSWVTVDNTTGTIDLSGTPDAAGLFEIVLRADDGTVQTDQTFWLPVLDNAPPVILNADIHKGVQNGQAVSINFDVFDYNGDDLTFEVLSPSSGSGSFSSTPTTTPDDPINADTVTLNFTPDVEGEQFVTFRATDSEGDSATHTVRLNVHDGTNEAPTATLVARTSIGFGETFIGRVEAFDENGDALDYDINFDTAGPNPTGMTIDKRTGIIVWQPTESQITSAGASPYEYTVTIDDGTATPVEINGTIRVDALSSNKNPKILTIPDGLRASADRPLVYKAIAFDPDNDPVTWTLVDGPQSASIDRLTGRFEWRPEDHELALEQTATIRVEDPYGGAADQQITLAASRRNSPPRIVSVPLSEIGDSETYTYTVRAEDRDGEAVVFTVEGTVDDISPIDDHSATITWSPSGTTKEFTIVAKDERGATDRQQVVINVSTGTVNVRPVFESTPVSHVAEDQTYYYRAVANDPNDTVTYAISGAPGISIGSSTGLIAWDPTGQVGSHTIIITADDGTLTAEQRYTLTVTNPAANDAPTVEADGPFDVVDGSNFVYDVKATDPDTGDSLTYHLVDTDSVAVTELNGMTIDDRGRVEWTVDASRTFTVRVTDDHGAYTDQSFSITNTADDADPLVSLRASTLDPQAGDAVGFAVTATDDVGVADIRVRIQEQWTGGGDFEIPVNFNGLARYEVSPDKAGESVKVTAIAVDTDGNESTSNELILDIIPVDTAAPVVEVTMPYSGALIEEVTNIVGKLYDGNSEAQLIRFEVRALSMETGETIILKSEFDDVSYLPDIGSETTTDTIATINPALFDDGSYRIEVEAEDVANNISSDFFNVTIESDIKIGNFSLSFTDLTVPVGGIPITIQRTYDSHRADEYGDFGYGWFLDQFTGRLETDVEPNARGSLWDDLNYGPAFKAGTRVTLTLPDGEQMGFTAVPQPIVRHDGGGLADRIAGGVLGNGADLFFIAFMPDAGQFSKLELAGGQRFSLTDDIGLTEEQQDAGIQSVQVYYDEATGEFRLPSAGGGIPFNPVNVGNNGVDFRLTTRDGMQYTYDSGTGDLLNVKDQLGNTFSVSEDGFSSTQPGGMSTSITIERDEANGDRISKIYDPEGNFIEYEYDEDTGDLVKVIDRTDRETTMAYAETTWSEAGVTSADLENILTSVTNGVDVKVLKVGFNADGTLRKIQDATDAAADFAYTLDGTAVGLPAGYTVEQVKDTSGSSDITTEVVRDARGNTVRTIQQLGTDLYMVSVFEYDENDYQTIVYESFEVDESASGDRFTDTPTVTLATSEFDEFGRITSTNDALGNKTFFEDYDQFGNPRRIIDPLGNETINEFDSNGQLRRTIDAEGNETRYNYDGRGNLTGIVQVNAQGESITPSTFTYDNYGRLDSVTDLNGITRYFVYDAVGNQTLSYSHWEDPHDGDATVDETIVTRTDYDTEGRVTGTKHYVLSGEQTFTDADDLNTETPVWSTTTTYDAAGRVSTSADRFGTTTTNHYDSRGNVVETLTQTKDENGNDRQIVSRTAYDASGRVIATTDPFITNGGTQITATADIRVTHTIYDDAGRVTQTRRIEGIKVEIGEPTTGVFITDFDEVAADSALLTKSETIYDSAGRVEATIGHNDPSISTDDVRTDYYYDAAGRQIATLGPKFVDGQGRTIRVLNEIEYDEGGRQEQVAGGIAILDTITDFDAHPSYTDLTNATYRDETIARGSTFTYDKLGRVTETTSVGDPGTTADDITTRTIYDALGRRTGEMDALGRQTTFHYDDQGHLTGVTLPAVRDADPSSSTHDQYEQPNYTYGYDDYGNQTSITDPRGNITQFTHDSQGRQLTRTLPLGVETPGSSTDFVETMEYFTTGDEYGLLYRSIDFEGRVMQFEYDTDAGVGGRVATKSYADSVADANSATWHRTVDYTYDAYGRVIEIDDSVDGVITRAYDAEHRLTQVASPEGTINYEYDDATGRLDATYTTNTRTEYGYDEAGRLIEVKLVKRNGSTLGTSETTKYVYNAAGQMDYEIASNDVTKDYIYDAHGRVDELHHFVDLNANNTYDSGSEDLIAGFDYTYDNAGNRTQAVEEFDTDNDGTIDQTQTFTWTYDALNRLVIEDYTGTLEDYLDEFAFDLASNRISLTRTTATETYIINYTVDNNDRLLVEVKNSDNNDNDTYTLYEYGPNADPGNGEGGDHTVQTKKTVYRGLDDTGDKLEEHAYTFDATGRMTKTIVTKYPTTGFTEQAAGTWTVTSGQYIGDDDATATDDAGAVAVLDLGEPVPSDVTITADVTAETVSGQWTNVGLVFDYQSENDFKMVRLATGANKILIEEFDGSSWTTIKEWDGAAESFTLAADTTYTVDLTLDGNDVTIDVINTSTQTAVVTGLTHTITGDTTTDGRLGLGTRNAKGTFDNITVTDNGASSTIYTENFTDGDAVQQGAGRTTTSDYTYDDKSRRVRQDVTVDGNTTATVYLIDYRNKTGFSQTLEEKDGSGNVQLTLTLGKDVIAQGDSGTEFLTFLYDIHGSTRAVLDTSGMMLEGYSYDAYGNPVSFDASDARTNYQYSGEWTDPNTGLQDLRNRWQQNGRFTKIDPVDPQVALPLTHHRYLYASANPIGNIDPKGLTTLPDVLTAVSIVALTTGIYLPALSRARERVGAEYEFKSSQPNNSPLFMSPGLLEQYTRDLNESSFDPFVIQGWDEHLALNKQVELYQLQAEFRVLRYSEVTLEGIQIADGLGGFTSVASLSILAKWGDNFDELPEVYDVVEYGLKSSPNENHHGILDIWADANFAQYQRRGRKTPAIVLDFDTHRATKAEYREWLFENTGKRVGGSIDWTNVSVEEVYALSERMFDAANVPESARTAYYTAFNRYLLR